MRRYALCIGNNNYTALSKLSAAKADAEAIAAELVSLGFDVDTGYDLQSREMAGKIGILEKKMMEYDAVLFYFAGHGFEIDGINILAPIELNPDDERALILHDAMREALVNCLVNSDFFQAWNVIIERYPDKVVMANPGTIITGKKQMLKGGISQPRNKGLFKMFNLIGLGEHAGSGVPDIYKVWRDAGLKDPIAEEMFGSGKPDRTVLTLPLLSADSPIRQSADSADVADILELKERHRQILSIMELDKAYATDRIAESIGLKPARTRQLLKELVEMGKLDSIGSTNGKRYIKRE